MSGIRDETGINVMNVFTYFERLGEESGVKVYIADHDPETGCRGFGIGMHGVQKRFLSDSGSALVLGLDSRQTLVERGFGAFLNLPYVHYLELPFTQEEFQQQAKSVCDAKASKADLKGVRESVAEFGFENIRRNVVHPLNGAILVTLKEAVALCRQAANGKVAGMNAYQKRILTIRITSLISSDERVRESLANLDREISALDGILPAVSRALCDQRAKLGVAVKDMDRFVTGISAWISGGVELESLTEFADIGTQVSRTFEDTKVMLAKHFGKG